MSTIPESDPDIPTFEELAADPEIAPLLRFDPVVRKVKRPNGWTPELQRELVARLARRGVAVLVRTVFIESVGRWERLFRSRPCTTFAQFVERVPIVKGRVDPKATTATGYAWLVWDKLATEHSRIAWIPPSRRTLERPDDYHSPQQDDLFAA